MILAVNTIVAEKPRRWFDEDVVPRLEKLAKATIRVAHPGAGPLPDPEDHTHLLLSGSELSAAVDHEWDEPLIHAIRSFVNEGKPVLGICHGHQMIAKALAGPAVVRRAARPEFGWIRIETGPNPLFHGMPGVVAHHSHFDEVAGLPDDFRVIGRTEHCAVQAYQYRDLPVWGVQFHPEVAYEESGPMIAKNVEQHPEIEEHVSPDDPGPAAVAENATLFRNFFGASARTV